MRWYVGMVRAALAGSVGAMGGVARSVAPAALLLTLSPALLTACNKNFAREINDPDLDGYYDPEGAEFGLEGPYDCDSHNPDVHPDADELCNGIDDNCDGQIDEDESVDAETWYADSDGDGYGDPDAPRAACEAPSLFVENSEDCDDADADVNPDSVWFPDEDHDGFGDASGAGVEAGCENPEPGDFVANDTDCDDVHDAVNPDADEIVNDGVDQDCNGGDDCFVDVDHDGVGSDVTIQSDDLDCEDGGESTESGDCNDNLATVAPGMQEVCDGVDQNCNGTDDEGVQVASYLDVDGDGYGDPASEQHGCTIPVDRIAQGGDCNDAQEQIHPGAVEQPADGVDADCDAGDLCWADADADGFGSTAVVESLNTTCDAPGESDIATDCNDANDGVYPGAAEVCDLVDGNCDGIVDTDVMTTFYRDADGDGFGGTQTANACTLPSGYTTTSTDCDDARSTVFPGAAEVCNGIDEDCDSAIDDGVLITFYADSDGDGYASDSAATTQACALPTGYASQTGDCDDGDALANPAEVEVCNYKDDNCQNGVDEQTAVNAGTWGSDADGDGYGSAVNVVTQCRQPVGYVANSSDCDDTRSTVNPGETESTAAGNCLNFIDDDCDGQKDSRDTGC